MIYKTTIVNGEIIRIPINNSTRYGKESNSKINYPKKSEIELKGLSTIKPLVNSESESSSSSTIKNESIINAFGIIKKKGNCLYFTPKNSNKHFKINSISKIKKDCDIRDSGILIQISGKLINLNKDGPLDEISYKSIISYGKVNYCKGETKTINIW